MDYYNKITNWKHIETVKHISRFCITHFGIYMLWIVIHYIAAHLYVYLCVPATIAGFLMSPFLVSAPHCYGLRWAIFHGGNIIVAMWTILGIWLLACILPLKTE